MKSTFTLTAAPRNSIWGAVDYADQVAPGWWSVGTPGHGGFILSAERVAMIPCAHLDASFNRDGHRGYFEEDCDWCIPALAFPEEFRAWANRQGKDGDKYLDAAIETFNGWIKAKVDDNTRVAA